MNSRRKVPETVQDTLAYKAIFPDGICQVNNMKFSKTIQFFDINYLLAQNEDKSLIFDNYCDFLNYFDASISVQLSFVNMTANTNLFLDAIKIEDQNDDFNTIRKEYSEMLQNQLAKGNNGLLKTKYITFSIQSDNYKKAKPRLERIEMDIINNFKVMGVKSYALTGKERVELLHRMCHQDTKEQLNFSWDLVKNGGMSTKDIIAPTSFNFSNHKQLKVGQTIGAVSHLQILAPELTDRMLADFLDMSNDIMVNFHIKSIDQTQAIKMIKRKITDIDKMKIEEQKKAVRAGYDMDILPSDLVTFDTEAKNLLEELQSRNERLFLVTILIYNTASSKQKLENIIFQVGGLAQKYNCAVRRLDYQQENGFLSTLPLGENFIDINRALTTSSTAIFIPFTTQELFMEGESLYYGLNALSSNMIMVDRKKLKNPNGLILGTPGSGKSFSAKREITNAFLITNDDIVISDPEAEYYPLVEKLGGQVIKLSPNSKDYINPLDINLNNGEDDPIRDKSDFIISLCEQVVGGRYGLDGEEVSLVDRCVRNMYEKYMENPTKENMPVLEDFYNILLDQKNEKATGIATRLEIYVLGSMNVFNHRTNVNIDNRIVCFDIKELGSTLKMLGMLIVQETVWSRVAINRNNGKSTRYYIDEFHLLLKDEATAKYSVEIWKRFRKWGGIPTGITQNVQDFLASREVSNIVGNSDFIYMLNQNAEDRAVLAKQLDISKHQLSYVTNSNEGEGLLFYGNVIIPFIDKFPKETMLYSIMTTKPEEISG
ncbi:VirB4-like conjugal transfer ATPase, CD1110 family [Acidaminobacter sp. JC074]|uniref:VirB4-like conjugal transfer ATPase, CD1110 family n=1 Tax=Acidaminobacter sp. JC074 TaxID=2530199 RepID=UPI0034DD7EB8